MKAFVVDRYQRQAALRLADMPTPEPREDEVLVEVHAAGVNLLDAKIRSGEFKLVLPYRLPLVLGHDVAGVVVKVGMQVRQFKVGDEVTRSMRGRMTSGSAHSLNSSRSRRRRSRSSPRA
jgi:NADPH:quinone reductase-like Zn-dependent oxidoreductase